MKQKLDMQGSNELMFGAELLDGRVLQGLQDRFCACNNLYCVCLSQMQGVVTKAYGSKEELNYIHEKVGMARHIVLLNRLITSVRCNSVLICSWISLFLANASCARSSSNFVAKYCLDI